MVPLLSSPVAEDHVYKSLREFSVSPLWAIYSLQVGLTPSNCGAGVLRAGVPEAQAKGWSPGAHQLDEVRLFHSHQNYPGTYCVPGPSSRFLFKLSSEN